MIYVDENGCTVGVRRGFGQPPVWFTARAKITGRVRTPEAGKRVVSPRLPPRGTREEAEADLEVYARDHEWAHLTGSVGGGAK